MSHQSETALILKSVCVKSFNKIKTANLICLIWYHRQLVDARKVLVPGVLIDHCSKSCHDHKNSSMPMLLHSFHLLPAVYPLPYFHFFFISKKTPEAQINLMLNIFCEQRASLFQVSDAKTKRT